MAIVQRVPGIDARLIPLPHSMGRSRFKPRSFGYKRPPGELLRRGLKLARPSGGGDHFAPAVTHEDQFSDHPALGLVIEPYVGTHVLDINKSKPERIEHRRSATKSINRGLKPLRHKALGVRLEQSIRDGHRKTSGWH